MTTNVTIEAHLCHTKEVKVQVVDTVSGEVLENHTLQDGERKEVYIYDTREVRTSEVNKEL
ncbi:MAG: hypothetical protein ACXW2E_01800 [Nitrososphaeraceae archaeon]